MSPILKAHSLSFAFSTTIIYLLWEKIAIIQTEYWIIKLIITFLLSLSFYKFVFQGFLFLCKRVNIIKKIILGRNYFEGLWIGYYLVDNEVEFYYEFFEQDLESLTIKGKSFDKNKVYTGEWTIVKPYLNVSDSRLTYYYEMNVVSSDNITLGCSRATIHWDKNWHAQKLVGFAIDSYSINKQPYVSIKINHFDDIEKWVKDNFWNEVGKLYENEI